MEIGTSLHPGPDARVIEAAGQLVLPGGVDPHTHLHPSFVDDFTTGSMAALAGGITTVGTFASTQQNETLLAAIERMHTRVRAESIADVIRYGQQSGEFPRGGKDADDIALQLGAMMDGLAIQVLLNDALMTPKKMLDISIDVAQRLIGYDGAGS